MLVLTAAANRDPERFPDPTRRDDQHYAFSAGPRYRPGAMLGCTEGRIILPLLLQRFPDLALAAAPDPLHNLMLRGPVHLPVRLAAESPGAGSEPFGSGRIKPPAVPGVRLPSRRRRPR
ncbi:cytochrome P450 [Micromonospora sp. HM134]|uniref:cytochrome P450 n=1 Tax=Micromonospora sp. HM134 TaxID=2583243 RepID=UPI00351B4B78